DRIGEGQRAAQRRHHHEIAIPALRCGSRSTEQWLANLRALSTGAASYRTNAIPIDELRNVVADPEADHDARLRAAVALRIADSDAAAACIRVAAETTASNELRVLLEDVAQTSDLERALARVR